MIVEAHCHPFGPPAYRDLRDKIRSVPDLIGFRRNHPELYHARDAEPLVDYVDELIADMDRYGVDKALIMTTGGCDSPDEKDEKTAAAVARYPDRLYGLASLGEDYSGNGVWENAPALRAAAPKQIADRIERLGFKGIGESHGGPFTTETHPVRIADDLRPIMETLADYRVPLLIATGWTQFPGRMYYADPIYVDEIAGRYPEVPIVLTKMGRAIQHYFESALIVAMRNPNVYFDTTSTTAEHLRRAVETIGADRIMFGTDWSPTWRCVEVPEPLYPRGSRWCGSRGFRTRTFSKCCGRPQWSCTGCKRTRIGSLRSSFDFASLRFLRLRSAAPRYAQDERRGTFHNRSS